MAGTCEACRAVITVTQKRIKCTNCMHLFHSECINYKSESASRTLWKCPNCVAGQRKGGDNSNTPVRNAAKLAKEPSATLPKEGETILYSSPPCSESPVECTIVSQIESILDLKLNVLKNEMVDKLKGSLVAKLRKELAAITANHKQLEDSHTKLLGEHENLRNDFDILKKQHLESGGKIQDLQAVLNKQQQWARMSNIEIVGLPETPNESAVELAVRIARHAGVQLQPAQIESAYRVQPMKKLEGRPKSIVVRLQTRMLKDQIISELRRTKGINTRDLGLGGANKIEQKISHTSLSG